jgi:hypothetical protein
VEWEVCPGTKGSPHEKDRIRFGVQQESYRKFILSELKTLCTQLQYLYRHCLQP